MWILYLKKSPFLDASTDGITGEWHLVEVKKVTSHENEGRDNTLCRLKIYTKHGDAIAINKKHKYYHQIQQQLFCTGLEQCHFVISNGTWLYTELVPFDSVFWTATLTKLKEFYDRHVFPELVYSRVFHGETRWNKDIAFPSMQ